MKTNYIIALSVSYEPNIKKMHEYKVNEYTILVNNILANNYEITAYCRGWILWLY